MQVHNLEPVAAATSRLGTRADGGFKAFPNQRILPGEKTQVWVDCTRRTSGNLFDVSNAASSNANIEVDDIGLYGKLVSIVLDATDAEAGDTADITFDVTLPSTFDLVLRAALPVIVGDQ